MNDLETISMPKDDVDDDDDDDDDDLGVSPALSSEPPSNRADSASAYPKRSSTVSFGHVFYDNFAAVVDRRDSLEDLPMLPMDDTSSPTTAAVTTPPPLSSSVSVTAAAASAFVVTSIITSVGSLDTGYQGDVETSRPTSRGAAAATASVTVPAKPTIGPVDPVMTDSDFFTESEAEDHCHRRARVIDGTLYPGDSGITAESRPADHHHHDRGSSSSSGNGSATATGDGGGGGMVEEMESSGVYSDFDKIFEEPPTSKDGTETISSTNTSTSPSSVNSQRIRSAGSCVDHQHQQQHQRRSSGSTTIPECAEDASSPASKRCKRPAAAAVAASKPKHLDVVQQHEQENRSPRIRKPAGRWDAVMNKIEKSKTDQKTRVNRLKDVKSKINSNSSLPSSTSNRLKESPTNGSEPISLTVRSHRENTPLKAKR